MPEQRERGRAGSQKRLRFAWCRRCCKCYGVITDSVIKCRIVSKLSMIIYFYLILFIAMWLGCPRESALPEEDYQRALQAAKGCDLMLVLGSSLRIIPACDLPAETLAAGGKLVIVNLQETHYDQVPCLARRPCCKKIKILTLFKALLRVSVRRIRHPAASLFLRYQLLTDGFRGG